MKCDELKVYHCNEWHNEYTEFYQKSDADAAIDELKAVHHKFRHSFASNLIRSGINIKAVQQLMRHDSIDITLNTYSHLLQNDLKNAVNAF